MAPDTTHELMDLGSILALSPPARIDRTHSSSAPSVLNDMRQEKESPEVADNSGEVRLEFTDTSGPNQRSLGNYA